MNYPKSGVPDNNKMFKQLDEFGIRTESEDTGFRFISHKNRFADFSVLSGMARWSFSAERVVQNECAAFFPGVGMTIEFNHGSILLVFPSGHIRWMTRQGFCFYSHLCFGRRPDFCQGDLVVFHMRNDKQFHHRAEMDSMITNSHFWYRPKEVRHELLNQWFEEESIYLGGNSRHRANGRLLYAYPVRNDHRTVQLYTLEAVVLSHDPEDEIHQPILLPAGGNYLITKLPGFSNPACEVDESEMILR